MHSKKSQFKNPFDMDAQFEEETLPMNKSTKQNEPMNVINPLPFNPYVIQNEPAQKTQKVPKKKIQQVIDQPQQIKQVKQSSKPIKVIPQQPHFDKPYQPAPEKVYQLNQDGDPPLLEDIGIDPQMIMERGKMVLLMRKPDQQTIEEPDLSGPIIIALLFGVLLLLSGKIHFGDIYAIFVFGNLLLYFLFNFMSQVDTIPLYSIMSTMGYAMIPMLLLGFFSIFTLMKGPIGITLSLAVSGWSSLAASNFIEALMRQTDTDRKILLMYPLFLFYVSFAMIIIF